MSNSGGQNITRRQVLKCAGVTGAILSFPTIVPSTVFGKNAPSNRVTVGMIGLGRQGTRINLRTMVGMKNVQIVALCAHFAFDSQQLLR